jgi:hypothetical protein
MIEPGDANGGRLLVNIVGVSPSATRMAIISPKR